MLTLCPCRCGEEGHMRRDCVNEEKTYKFINEDGEEKEMYVPKGDVDAEELFGQGIASGINFAKYDDIPEEEDEDSEMSDSDLGV